MTYVYNYDDLKENWEDKIKKSLEAEYMNIPIEDRILLCDNRIRATNVPIIVMDHEDYCRYIRRD